MAGAAVFAATFAGAAVLAAGAGFLAGGIMISKEKLASRQPARIAPIRTTAAAVGATRDQPDRHYCPGILGQRGRRPSSIQSMQYPGGFGHPTSNGPALKPPAVAMSGTERYRFRATPRAEVGIKNFEGLSVEPLPRGARRGAAAAGTSS